MHETQINYRNEIELIDIFRVIWKWKYIILSGVIICVLATTIINLYMKNIYNIEVVLRPGLLSIRENGKNTYIDSATNIKTIIEGEDFNRELVNKLNNSKENIPNKLNFKISIPKKTNNIRLIYETTNVKQGIEVLNQLIELLIHKYSKIVEYYKNEFEVKINFKQSEINKKNGAKVSTISNIKNIEKRIDELNSELNLISGNTKDLINERTKLISNISNSNNILTSLLYSNTIQQNIQLSNTYKNEIYKYKLKLEEQLQKVNELENEAGIHLAEKEIIENQKENVQNIQIVKYPSPPSKPIRPKSKIFIILSFVVSFIFMIIISFLFEYLKKNKSDTPPA